MFVENFARWVKQIKYLIGYSQAFENIFLPNEMTENARDKYVIALRYEYMCICVCVRARVCVYFSEWVHRQRLIHIYIGLHNYKCLCVSRNMNNKAKKEEIVHFNNNWINIWKETRKNVLFISYIFQQLDLYLHHNHIHA